MSLTGKLIVIEGLEGSGKSTAVHTLIELLSSLHIKTVTTREPGGTAIGEIIRSIIKNTEYKDVLDDRGELLLLYTARLQLVEQVIKPALERGYWVIADRFELSSLAYQGGGRGLNIQKIKELSDFCLEGFKPDYTLYLDISPELGMKRVRARGEFDRIEQQSIEFFNRVHQTYINYINNDPSSITIDASLPLPEVQSQIKEAMIQFIEHKR